MSPDGIIEAVDITTNGRCRLGARLERGAPNQLAFQRLEERFDDGVEQRSAPSGIQTNSTPREILTMSHVGWVRIRIANHPGKTAPGQTASTLPSDTLLSVNSRSGVGKLKGDFNRLIRRKSPL